MALSEDQMERFDRLISVIRNGTDDEVALIESTDARTGKKVAVLVQVVTQKDGTSDLHLLARIIEEAEFDSYLPPEGAEVIDNTPKVN